MSRHDRICWAVCLIPASLAWALTWIHFAPEWAFDEQYHYGFLVPFLAVGLIWQRRRCLPAVSLPDGLVAAGWIFSFLALALGAFLFVRDPLWRLTGALLQLAATLFTLTALGQMGGLRLVRRFLLPIGFLWLAVPWPMGLENRIIQTLTRGIAAGVAWALNLSGVPALARGNLIELAHAAVGVDAACSGIQSFQAAIMLAFFAVGLFWINRRRAVTLFAGAVSCAIAVNFLRVFALSAIAQSGSSSEFFHDSVGLLASVIIFGVIFAWANAYRSRAADPVGLNSTSDHAFQFPPLPLTSSLSGIAAAGFLAAILATWPAANLRAKPPVWLDREPPAAEHWQVASYPATNHQRSMLQFSSWFAGRVRTDEGELGTIIHLTWSPQSSAPGSAFYHSPVLCQPSAGWQATGKPSFLKLTVGDRRFECAVFYFTRDDERIAVLQHVVRGAGGQSLSPPPAGPSHWLTRLLSSVQHPADHVTEEVLVYLPIGDTGLSLERFAQRFINHLLLPAN